MNRLLYLLGLALLGSLNFSIFGVNHLISVLIALFFVVRCLVVVKIERIKVKQTIPALIAVAWKIDNFKCHDRWVIKKQFSMNYSVPFDFT